MPYPTSPVLKHSGYAGGAFILTSIEALMIAGITKVVCTVWLLGHATSDDILLLVIMGTIPFWAALLKHRHIPWKWALLATVIIAVTACAYFENSP